MARATYTIGDGRAITCNAARRRMLERLRRGPANQAQLARAAGVKHSGFVQDLARTGAMAPEPGSGRGYGRRYLITDLGRELLAAAEAADPTPALGPEPVRVPGPAASVPVADETKLRWIREAYAALGEWVPMPDEIRAACERLRNGEPVWPGEEPGEPWPACRLAGRKQRDREPNPIGSGMPGRVCRRNGRRMAMAR